MTANTSRIRPQPVLPVLLPGAYSNMTGGAVKVSPVNTHRTAKLLTLIILVVLMLACSIVGTPPTPTAAPSTPAATATQPSTLSLITANTQPPALVVRCVVAGQTWNLRDAPDETANILGVLAGGDSVQIIAGGDWAKVKVLTGSAVNTSGFVNSKGLEMCRE